MDNKAIWDKGWEQLAEYSQKSAGNRWAYYLIERVCREVKLPNDEIIVDVGCGIGNKSSLLASLFPTNLVYGVDFSEKGIECAKMFYKEDRNNLMFECLDARDLKKAFHQPIGLISAFELIEHIEDWESFLGDVCELSSKYVLLSTPTGRMREYEKQLGHYRNYKKGELESFMKKKGYETVSVLYAGFPFWSPITRDAYNFVNMSEKHIESDNVMEVSYNPVVHCITWILYRYLSFKRIGDQFVGLFAKTDNSRA